MVLALALIGSLAAAPPAPMVYLDDHQRIVVRRGETARVYEAGREPALSPDGTRVAYWQDDPGRPSRFGESPLMLLDLASGKAVELQRGENQRPVWSRDGQTLYFLRLRDGRREVAAAPPKAGALAKTHFRSGADLYGLSRSPDGADLVVHDLDTVYWVNWRGENQRKMPADTITGVLAGTYSIDRFIPRPNRPNQLLYSGRAKLLPQDVEPDNEATAAFLYDLVTRTRRQLTPPTWYAQDVAWSRDGESILFSGSPEGVRGASSVYQQPITGVQPVRIGPGREPGA